MTLSRFSSAEMVLLITLAGVASAGIPPGYYDPAAGLCGEALRAALHGIIDNHAVVSYEYIWTAFYTTDDKPDGMVWDMYSDIPGGTPPYEYTFGEDEGGSASEEGEGYNREHSWPQSWFGSTSPMNTDLFHIIPTDIYVNNRRGNYPYGEVDSPTWTSLNGSRLGPCTCPGYSGTVFEPRDDFKGDLARNYFYMTTRYFNEDAGWPGSPMTDGAQLLEWAEDMLVDWHLSDPVGTKELDRNEAVYDIQNNRNPFIDHPEFVLMVYDPTSVEEEGDPFAAILDLRTSPNPFTSTVAIGFELSEAAPVDLEIFDIGGRLVRVLLDDIQLAAGSHEAVWSGVDDHRSPLAAGVYFCRISTPYGVATSRMLLIR